MNRRGFLQSLLSGAAGVAVADPVLELVERALWVPKTQIVVPRMVRESIPDWVIDTDTQTLRYVGTGGYHKIRDVYEGVQDWLDELENMDVETIMLPMARESITMENGWRIEPADMHYLTNGSIRQGDTLWSDVKTIVRCDMRPVALAHGQNE